MNVQAAKKDSKACGNWWREFSGQAIVQKGLPSVLKRAERIFRIKNCEPSLSSKGRRSDPAGPGMSRHPHRGNGSAKEKGGGECKKGTTKTTFTGQLDKVTGGGRRVGKKNFKSRREGGRGRSNRQSTAQRTINGLNYNRDRKIKMKISPRWNQAFQKKKKYLGNWLDKWRIECPFLDFGGNQRSFGKYSQKTYDVV